MFKCEICGKEYNNMNSLSRHIRVHMSQEEYYRKFMMKDENECKCKICGKPTKFRNFAYSNCCSQSCRNIYTNQNRTEEQRQLLNEKISKANKSEESLNKRKKTNLDRYGVEYTTQNKEVQNKRKSTCIEKYGVSCSFQADEVKEKIQESIHKHYGEEGLKNKEVRKKAIKTSQERYDTNNPAQSKVVKDKIKATTKEHYGVDCSWKSPEIVKKIKNTKVKKLKQFCIENDCIPMQEVINSYGTGWAQYKIVKPIEYNKNILCIKNSDISIIQKYYEKMKNYRSSNQQVEIRDYIKSIYNGTIIDNDRTILNGKELDIYIPDKNLAIEFNGNYWHSNSCKGSMFHFEKSKECYDKGIRLIHIFEYEWNNSKEICKSIIACALNIHSTIYARKCIIKTLSLNEEKLFLLENHIQGYVPSSYRLGLYYKNELVQIITIGKSRFKKDEYELLRMCTKLNTQVIGGFSKLLKHQPYKNLISYVDFSKFNDNGYEKVGFIFNKFTKPNYIYWDHHQHFIKRYEAQKHKLFKLLGDNFDLNKTEVENMTDAGYLQIFDSGNIKYKLN